VSKRPPSGEDLQLAVDAMIQTTRIRLHREDTGRIEWQTIPSIWTQLEGSARWSGSGSGGGAYGSRPTIATGVVSLIIDIATAAVEGAMEHAGVNRKTVPGNLRAIAADLPNSTSDSKQDQITWWVKSLHKWINAAKIELHTDPDLPRNLRGTQCPDCGADTVTTGEGTDKVRTSALTVVWTCTPGDQHKVTADWTIRAIECRACQGTWFRGTDLDALVDGMLNANHTRETLTG
jgi:RNase P subunit RPR2